MPRNPINPEDIQQFITLTNSSRQEATEYLKSFGSLDSALTGYFAAKDVHDLPDKPLQQPVGILSSGNNDKDKEMDKKAPGSKSSGGNKRYMTFSDMVREEGDRDDEDGLQPRSTFAGGETSGLEVQDPTFNNDNDNDNSVNASLRALLEKARRNGERMAEGESPVPSQPRHRFTGRGYRLGSTYNAPSEVVEDISSEPERVTREITFWKEGFQVGDDGPLYRYDDPANTFYLNELNQGRAPLKLLDVKYGQDVEVNVHKRLDESYKPPKRKIEGFFGTGRRLGSPIPGDHSYTSDEELKKEVNSSQPATEGKQEEHKGDSSVQIRYASGKREIFRCNASDTVQSLYDHVRQNTENDSRAFTLNYTFPVKPIEDKHLTIKEADLVNAVVVQRWV